MKNILVIAPHLDDETLGCGATLFRYRDEGRAIHWLLCSELSEKDADIETVSKRYEFQSVTRLKLTPTKLDQVPMGALVEKISALVQKVKVNTIFVPYIGDIHSDHKVVFEAALSCTKTFRYPSIEEIYAYETLSETNFNLDPKIEAFRPNFYVNVEKYIEQKIATMKLLKSEMGEFPFPRSERAIMALAELRGSESGYKAAEAFLLLKQRI